MIENLLLSDEELDNIEWNETPSVPDNYMADFTFIDDYRKEVHRILEAQLEKVVKWLEDIDTRGCSQTFIDGIKFAIQTIKQHLEEVEK